MESLKHLYVGLLLLVSATCHALEVPNELKGKVVTFMLGYGTGGPHDTVARKLVQSMNKIADINFVIINKPGASGVLAANDVLANGANGLMLLQSGTELAINYFEKIPQAPKPDAFLPVFNIFEFHPSPIVKRGSINTVQDLVNASRTGPGISYGSVTTVGALLAAHFMDRLGVKNALHIPFRTAPQMMTSILTGEVTFTMSSAWPQFYDNGQVQVLALAGSRRPDYPNILTLREAGYNIDISEAVSVYIHPDTPKHLTEFYNRLLSLALNDPEVVQTIQQRNGKPIGGNLQRAKENHVRYTATREDQHRKYKHLLQQ